MKGDEETEKQRLLEYLAHKIAADPDEFFLATAVERYQAAHQLDRAAMAQWLGITPEQVTLLSICGRPSKTDPAKYARDITEIATKYQIDREKLTAIIEIF